MAVSRVAFCCEGSFEQGRDQQGGGEELQAQIFGVGSSGREINAHLRTAKVLFVDRVQELDGYQNLIARLGLIEKYDGLQVVAQGDAAPVEVDDLRHGTIRVGSKMEPDAAAGEIVAVEGLGHFDPGGDTRRLR